jgi:hypothetical protein
MTKEERRAEKVRMLVQSGSLFADAAQALVEAQRDFGRSMSLEAAIQCVFVAEVTCALRQTGEGSK